MAVDWRATLSLVRRWVAVVGVVENDEMEGQHSSSMTMEEAGWSFMVAVVCSHEVVLC
jgi:hypothetical protein